MSTYICVECGTIENSTGGGNYWNVRSNLNLFNDSKANEELLCRFCTPTEFDDGTLNTEKIEGISRRSERKHWSELGTREKVLQKCNPSDGNLVNAVEYFQLIDSRNKK